MGLYEKLPTLKRKDALTAARFNQLRDNARFVQQVLRAEHLESNGEHNAQEIARTLGTVKYSAGYSLVGFNADAQAISNPSVGKTTLTLPPARYTADRAPLMLQNASERGDLTPTLSWAAFDDDQHVSVYSSYWTGTLGVAGSGFWSGVGEDASYHLGVHGQPLSTGTLGGMGGAVSPINGLRISTYNAFLQRQAALQVAMDVGHTAGVHDIREISKLLAHITWTGSAWSIASQEHSGSWDAGDIARIAVTSPGVANVAFTRALASVNYQVFIDVDYARAAGGALSDYFIIVPPRDEMTTSGFNLYFYKKLLDGSSVEYFDRSGAVDFYLWIFDDH